MNAAVWTLWLITFSTTSGSSVVTPLAAFAAHDECIGSIQGLNVDMRALYGAKNPPTPGLLFCVYGVPVKR